MPPKKNGFTKEEHEDVAETLSEARLEINDVFNDIVENYPKKNPVYKQAARCVKALQELYHEMEEDHYTDFQSHDQNNPYAVKKRDKEISFVIV